VVARRRVEVQGHREEMETQRPRSLFLVVHSLRQSVVLVSTFFRQSRASPVQKSISARGFSTVPQSFALNAASCSALNLCALKSNDDPMFSSVLSPSQTSEYNVCFSIDRTCETECEVQLRLAHRGCL
jgi:hypothetical protein